MKHLLSFATLLLSALAGPSGDSTFAEWNEYKAAYSKFYQTPEEDARRLETYLDSKRKVEQHNARYQRGETTFTMAVNEFADWFPEELDRLMGLKVHKEYPRGGRIYQRRPDAVVPESINWVEKGAVTSVKQQGQCGSCYAFSAAGALEGLMFRSNKTIMSLSAQELMDCSQDANCNGGDPVLCYITAESFGVEAEESYPYEEQSDVCRPDVNKAVMFSTGYVSIGYSDEEALKEAVGSIGPVSVAMAVGRDFTLYDCGVYDGPCGIAIDHAMLVVGYGTDKTTGQDYWLVKNSWGESWGEKGYVRVIRNKNKCFIADFASYPTDEGNETETKMAD